MWLVLCSANDIPAIWAYQGLRARGLDGLELVSAEMLAHSLVWEHRLGKAGVSIRIKLPDGRSINGDSTEGAINRLLAIPATHFNLSDAKDRDYATQEMSAFFMSWLASLRKPVLNRPTPQGLSGHWRHPSEWSFLAAKAGLPVAPYRQTGFDPPEGALPYTQPARTVFTVQSRPVGEGAPAEILEGCSRLADSAGTQLMGINFHSTPSNPWTFSNCSPMPDLRQGGAPLLDALAEALLEGRN